MLVLAGGPPGHRPTPAWKAAGRGGVAAVGRVQLFLTIACVLAAIGAITDSAVTVVGAVVLGPEFGPLAAVAVGLVLRRGDLIRRGCVAPAVGFPSAFSLIVAMLAGVAGMLALTSAKSASLVGVFSVTTVPAAAFAAMALVEGRFEQAALSGLQLVVNLVGIVAAAALGLLVAQRAHHRSNQGRKLSEG